MSQELVLVTGGSGFIALHIILQLLNKGYPVRTTVRSLSREAQLKQALSNNGVTNVDSLQVVAANLEKDEGWVDAAKGCSYVLHVASPFPDYAPKHEDELIKPAREGTLRVLRAAKAASVKRVVVTSSFAAIGYGPYQPGHVFTEKDWTPSNDAKNVGAYARSKTIAEEAAWKYVKDENEPFELATVNPVAVTGPVLDPSTRISTSLTMVQKMLSGGAPMVPHMQIGIVDVRDVADLHLRAMTDPKANGERFLCITGQPMFMKEMAIVLKERLGKQASKVGTSEVPSFLLRIAARFSSTMALVAGELDKEKSTDNQKAVNVLGWQPMSREDTLEATAKSLIEHKLV